MREPSPRLWGARHSTVPGSRVDRAIPTPVGSTDTQSETAWRSPSHPHACGEHKVKADKPTISAEPSPRLWGAPGSIEAGMQSVRAIPTPVGSTSSRCRTCCCRTSHPHACGEHLHAPDAHRPVHESSPRLWGAHARGDDGRRGLRVIPTPVGSTGELCRGCSPSPSHPHACGEHL